MSDWARRTLLTTIALWFLTASGGLAQTIDQGILEIRRNDRVVAEESFRIERTNSRGIDITVNSTARYNEGANVVLTSLIELDRDGQPVAAQFDRSGPPGEPSEIAVITVDPRRVSYRVLSPEGDNWGGNFRRPAALMFWNESQFAPYLVAPTPGTSVQAIDVAGRRVRELVEVRDEGSEDGARVFSVNSEGIQIRLWYDDDRLMRLEIPSLSVVAIRRTVQG